MEKRSITTLKKVIILLVLYPAVNQSVNAQDNYWQQEVHYKIDVRLNDKDHTLQGSETIEYINHSPDTLRYIWFHIWPNAYKNNKTAFYAQLSKLKDRSDKLKSNADGYIDSLEFAVNGKAAAVEAQAEHIDIIKILLPDQLLPGQRISINTPFFVKIPSYVSRLGYYKDTYMISQWYPKPAVYDKKGWHPMPYLDQGEFYSEFGNFDVRITVPEGYVVAATGEEVSGEKQLAVSNQQSAISN